MNEELLNDWSDYKVRLTVVDGNDLDTELNISIVRVNSNGTEMGTVASGVCGPDLTSIDHFITSRGFSREDVFSDASLGEMVAPLDIAFDASKASRGQHNCNRNWDDQSACHCFVADRPVLLRDKPGIWAVIIKVSGNVVVVRHPGWLTNHLYTTSELEVVSQATIDTMVAERKAGEATYADAADRAGEAEVARDEARRGY